ncbi:uncharacterized protein LOC133742689 [Rosa rugosa]|uniref:uncharacterized protein LOC133742689 n=1 Tax=Rosa rugosa TaxID=74645 RepID=UPI002B4133AE|nr:uncharacterized protein LOC133742689 [Rosa rugosa]XP_062026348.1 uncharacterized protein LOC133742689 [Rosa rugosa]
MHGRGGEERKRSRHMLTVPTADGSSSSSSNSTHSFFKDGRKISVGDCALFKPPQDSPPFIGIIRWLITGKENKLRVGVNWLYRPSEVKLGKGELFDAELNEIFYSFHKDEIPAASLLHPCKVAFLPKGVKLPSGISSFVCRRVFDITNKCLWWLTDQDYINERQEEVDKLLYKTRVEMQATVQSGGRSPKPMNGPSSASQLKAGSDGVQNSASSFSSQVKGKKRERGDQGSEPVKRERITRIDDGDSGHCKQESTLKSEIAKITERGGLVDSEGVEKLVQLMGPDRNEKKIDVAGRSMLASVLAATDKFDCLSRFVQLRGLPVFDEWLQEVHKGKIGDGSASKDSDKCVEEFLLVLLRALDKLPVNLNALQMCNIGKSVNHLRTHKNLEIQKKARSLVDTWKKRVEAEMKINEAKSGLNQAVPWSARPRLPEVSHGGNRHSGLSTDVAIKSSVTQLSVSNKSSVKLVQGDNITKSASASPVSLKSVPSPVSAGSNLKDGQSRIVPVGVTVDLPMTTTRDEKSSSSSQSHNNSQSCSNDHARNGGVSGKEDARSSTAGSMNKTSGGSSRPRKSINGFPGSTPSGAQRETVSSRSSSLHKNPASEKSLQPGISEKVVDDNKLIVKIPNRGRSPAQSGSGGSFEDLSNMNSRASSPMHSEKHDQLDCTLKEKVDVYRATGTSDVNTESWQSNDFKDILTGSDEGDGSPAAVTNEERDPKKTAEVPKAASSSSGNEQKPGNAQEASFSSMHALVESCVKYAEGNASVGDDLGMNLLASVAADEMSKSESPTDSPQRSTPVSEHLCKGNDSRVKSPLLEDLARDESQSNVGADDEYQKHGIVSATFGTKDGGGKGPFPENKEKPIEVALAPAVTPCPAIAVEETMDSEGTKPPEEKKVVGGVDETPDIKQGLTGHLSNETKANDAISRAVDGKEATEESSLHPPLEVDGKLSTIQMHSESVKGTSEGVMLSSEKVSAPKADNTDEMEDRSCSNQTERQRPESNDPILPKKESDNSLIPENRAAGGSSSAVTDHNSEHMEGILESKVANGQLSEPVVLKVKPDLPMQEVEHVRSKKSKVTGMDAKVEAEEAGECTSTTADTPMSAVGVSDMDAKVEFDLNEGFNADDGKFGEPNNLTAPGCSTALRLISPLPFSVSSLSSGLPASVTVPSAAKGPCVPPDDLLKGKQEDGWKGTAATSAFRPAEPRKVSELPLGATNIAIPDPTAGKQGRPALDIDLNVPDERVLEDMASQEIFSLSAPTSNNDFARDQSMSMAPVRSSGGLDLDLNQVDEASEIGSYSLSNIRRMNNPILSTKASGGPPNGEVSHRRDFDLNNGPAFDDVSAEPAVFSQHTRSSMPSQPPNSGFRMSNTEVGNFSSWFSPANTYSAVTIPSIMPDRGEQPFPIVATGGPQRTGPPTGSNPFTPDVYRGSVVSSSPAVPYPSTSFQYPVFPFGNSFPLPSATFAGGSTTYLDSSAGRLCIPAVRSQLLGPGSMIPSNYPRPYVVNVSDGSNNSSAENSRKWGRQGLDLNAGPGGPDLEGRDVTSPLAPWQFSVASSQALAEEQARMFQMSGGTFKRKEPEGGWDGYKQPWK